MEQEKLKAILNEQIKEAERMIMKYDGVLQFSKHLLATIEKDEEPKVTELEVSANGQS